MAVRRLAAGFLAGASSVAGILAIFVLLLFCSGIWDFLRNVSFQVYGDVPFWQSLIRALGQSLGALPRYFWSARWGMVLLGVMGLALAVVDVERPRIRRPWRNQLGFVVTIGVVAAIVTGVQYANRAALNAWVASQPELYSQQDMLLVSDATMLFVSLLVTLAIAYIVWVAWNWWYDKWSVRLRVSRPALAHRTHVAAAARLRLPAQDDWREYQARLAQLKRQAPEEEPSHASAAGKAPSEAGSRSWIPFILAGLAAATVLVYVLLRLYHDVGSNVASGEIWVTPQTPAVAAPVSFSQTPKRVILSNTAGSGTVDILVRPGAGGAPVRTSDNFSLADSASSYQTSEVDLSGLAPGDYLVEVRLNEGEGGLLRYMTLYGGGLAGRLASLALGFAAGTWLALVTVLILEILTRGNWVEGVAAESARP